MNRMILEFVIIEKVESVRIAFRIHKPEILRGMNALSTPMKTTQEHDTTHFHRRGFPFVESH